MAIILLINLKFNFVLHKYCSFFAFASLLEKKCSKGNVSKHFLSIFFFTYLKNK